MRLLNLGMALGLLLLMENSARAQTAETQTQVEDALIKERKKAAQAQVEMAEKLRQAAKEALSNGKKPAQDQDKKGAEVKAKEKAATLEDMLARALRNNPDIHVAEAKMREAEAELNRARLLVAQKVMTFRADYDSAKALYEEANNKYLTTVELQKRHAITMEEVNSAGYASAKMKAELARVEAQLPFLLGKTGGPISSLNSVGELPGLNAAEQHAIEEAKRRALELHAEQMKINQGVQNKNNNLLPNALGAGAGGFGGLAGGGFGGFGGGFGGVMGGGSGAGPPPAMFRPQASLPPGIADKIHKFLDSPIKARFTQTKPELILDHLRTIAPEGVNIVLQKNLLQDIALDLNLGTPIPAGALFQFLEDHTIFRFIIRDYGIVVSDPNSIPPGAIRLLDAWKQWPAEKSGS